MSASILHVAEVIAQLDRLGVARRRMTLDSRAVGPGDVFVALPGAHRDGREFIAMALAAGAGAVIQEARGAVSGSGNARVLDVPDLAPRLGALAAEFYRHPARDLRLVGVTGTNGKTTIVNGLQQAFAALGERCAAIGTLGVSFEGQHWSTANTTPDAVTLQTTLRDLRDAGARVVAMEVSSHALALGRVAGLAFDSAIFTNLTQDHLDFHQTIEAYAAAKATLFTDHPVAHRILNADDPFGRALIGRELPDTWSFGLDVAARVRGDIVSADAQGMCLAITCDGQRAVVRTPMIGRFNASNLLAVATTLLARGVPSQDIAGALTAITAAPGRLQRVGDATPTAPRVYVDYAHTPDALAKALDAVRETDPEALAVVFGCGGDRDRGKRAQMGRIADERADRVYVTSDNPRSESPERIIADVLQGVAAPTAERIIVLPDRAEAIARAISRAGASDAVLVAGKGHETYQESAGVRRPFSDVEHAERALLAWRLEHDRGARHVVG